jgi:hypothetical protein
MARKSLVDLSYSSAKWLLTMKDQQITIAIATEQDD